jgi:hypothetical protein
MIAIAGECQQVVTEARERLGLTQRALDKRARLGSTTVAYVESGRTQSTVLAPLTRLLKILQQQAELIRVPAKLTKGVLRVLKSVERPGQGTVNRRRGSHHPMAGKERRSPVVAGRAGELRVDRHRRAGSYIDLLGSQYSTLIGPYSSLVRPSRPEATEHRHNLLTRG